MGAVDFDYLEGFAAGDRRVVTEVLELFLIEAKDWLERLDGPGWADLLHTMKGAGRGVGAHALGEICERAEVDGREMAPDVRTALAATVAEIEAYLTAA